MNTVSGRKHNKRFYAAGLLAAAVITASLSGCGADNSTKDPESQAAASTAAAASTTAAAAPASTSAQSVREDMQVKIMQEFTALSTANASPSEGAKFIDKNISQVSSENAALLIDGFEKLQNSSMAKLEEKFSVESMQKELGKVYKPGFDINRTEGISSASLKELLAEARDGGFKVETAEGMYFPIINYEFYKRFVEYTAPDMKEYIELMAVESNSVPAKDAALIIKWDEILKRALRQEKFIAAYGSSIKINDVKGLYNKYTTFIFLGLNNTPLFSYDTKIMKPEAQSAYTTALQNGSESILLKAVGDFMNLLKKSSYKLTDEADKYRKSLIENMK